MKKEIFGIPSIAIVGAFVTIAIITVEKLVPQLHITQSLVGALLTSLVIYPRLNNRG